MKTTRLAILIMIALLSKNLNAQEFYQNIRGTIIDVDSKLPVIGANVLVLESDPLQGGSSDINGDFIIMNVAIGRVDLKVSAIGYEPVYLNNIVVESAKESILNIENIKESI